MKTAIPSAPGIERHWHLIDAEEAVLGRISSKAANLLMGKHKPSYTPFIDTGDHVGVVNAEKVRLTGRKGRAETLPPPLGLSGRPNWTKARKVREIRPTRMIEEAIQGYASQDQDGEADVPQAASIRRSEAPSSGAEADRADDRLTIVFGKQDRLRKKY